MLKKYSFFGLPLEMLVIFGIFGLLLVLIVGCAFLEQRRRRKQARDRNREGSA